MRPLLELILLKPSLVNRYLLLKPVLLKLLLACERPLGVVNPMGI